MTTRMSVALWFIGVGLAVSALAGVPLIAADVIVGPAFWWSGLAVALVGSVVALTAIPGQRQAGRELKWARRVGLFQVTNERHRLLRRQAHIMARVRLSVLEYRRVLDQDGKGNGSDTAYLAVLESTSDMHDVAAQLDNNAAEYFKRTGRMPYDEVDDPYAEENPDDWNDPQPEPPVEPEGDEPAPEPTASRPDRSSAES